VFVCLSVIFLHPLGVKTPTPPQLRVDTLPPPRRSLILSVLLFFNVSLHFKHVYTPQTIVYNTVPLTKLKFLEIALVPVCTQGSSSQVNGGLIGGAGPAGLPGGGGSTHNTPSSLRQHRLSGQSSESGVSSIASSSSRYSCAGPSSWGAGHDILEDSSPSPQPSPSQADCGSGAPYGGGCSGLVAYGKDIYQQERKVCTYLCSTSMFKCVVINFIFFFIKN